MRNSSYRGKSYSITCWRGVCGFFEGVILCFCRCECVFFFVEMLLFWWGNPHHKMTISTKKRLHPHSQRQKHKITPSKNPHTPLQHVMLYELPLYELFRMSEKITNKWLRPTGAFIVGGMGFRSFVRSFPRRTTNSPFIHFGYFWPFLAKKF